MQEDRRLDAPPRADAGLRAGAPVTVGDLMRPAVMSVEREAHLAAASYLFKKAGDTALVVIDDEIARVPVAVVTEADIAAAVAEGRNPEEVRISELVGREPVTVAPGTGVAEAAELMLSSHIRHLPVVDGRRLVGIVDVSDVCRGLLASRGDVASRPVGSGART
jgi:CBS domain-containing protein